MSIGFGRRFAGKVIAIEDEVGYYSEVQEHTDSMKNKINMSVVIRINISLF
jgi:hypothetical protein